MKQDIGLSKNMTNNKIRVGFDISQLAYLGGVHTYTEQLTYELSKINFLEMYYFYSSLRKPYLGNLSNVKNYHMPTTLVEILFNSWRNISIDNFLGSLDIFHSSDWTQPPTKAKKVTTYHDVVPLKFPQWSEERIINVHKRRLKLVEKEIDMVIAVSQSTKNDLLEISHIPESKITVIYEGVSDNFKLQSSADVAEFRLKMNLPDKFLLAISGIGERRNISRIKEAAKGYQLIILGQDIPHISFQQLPLLYSCATVLVYASLYEGFGLPILEAQACGVPVLTSNVSAMPEVGGIAALYVNPLDTGDIKKKIRLLMEDENVRQDLTKKGFQNVKKYSWEKTAAETSAIYRRLKDENLD